MSSEARAFIATHEKYSSKSGPKVRVRVRVKVRVRVRVRC